MDLDIFHIDAFIGESFRGSTACVIALEVDLELLSIAVMTAGSGTAIWKTIAYISAGIIILKIKNKMNK